MQTPQQTLPPKHLYIHVHVMCTPTPLSSLQMCSGMSVWLAVNEDGISLLSPSSMDTRQVYSYDQLTAFGEDGDHLVLVTSSQPGSHSNTETEKVLLVMSKAKVSIYSLWSML